MKKYLVFLSVLALLYGCATDVYVKDDNLKFAPASQFSIGNITNECGINPDEGDKDSSALMKEALEKALEASSLPKGLDGYSININIVEYSPGDAFKRWLWPGYGETKLVIIAMVKDKSNQDIGEIKVTRSISAGGAYTIGAWKYVFDDAANTVVEEVKKRIKV